MEAFDKTRFAENLNTKFSVRVGVDKTIELELTQITESNSAPNIEQYSLVFRGPLDGFLSQQTHSLEHQRMGTMEVFLVPIGRDEQGFQYEAIFSRIIT